MTPQVSIVRDTATRYIVRLKSPRANVSEAATLLLQGRGGKVAHTFEHVFPGFVAEGLTQAAAQAITANPMVEYVEKEGFSYPTDWQSVTAPSQWGLDWIDQHYPALDGQYSYTYSGAGVNIYIVDSGVRGGHVEFTGRMGDGACLVSFTNGCSPTIDPIGHGTSVASQAAGSTAGVAKRAIIHSVRIDDGGGGARDGDIIAGLDWVLGHRVMPAVVNLSYGDDGSCGCGGSFSQRDALQRLVDAGITVVKSAGNANRDAFMWRPNRVTGALVVAAAGWDPGSQSLYRMYYSSYGSTVDIYAPGSGTYAATNASDYSYTDNFGGTSGASPYVAGVAAQILQYAPQFSSADVESTIRGIASYGVVGLPRDSGHGVYAAADCCSVIVVS